MRIRPVDINQVSDRVRAVLDAQTVRWGAPLLNHLIYARVPAIFTAIRAMWGGLDAAQLIGDDLQVLVNRRVAALNGCEF